MTSADASTLLKRARAMVARLSPKLDGDELDDLAGDLVLLVLEGHKGGGLPSYRWMRWRALDVLRARTEREDGVLWAPERIDQC